MTTEINYANEYDNSARVPNSGALVNKYITDAANFREYVGSRAELNLAYGPGERNMMDLFWPESEAGRAKRSPIVIASRSPTRRWAGARSGSGWTGLRCSGCRSSRWLRAPRGGP